MATAASIKNDPLLLPSFKSTYKRKRSILGSLRVVLPLPIHVIIAFFDSVLTVIDIESDPVEVFEHLKSLGLRGADFLLPAANYDHLSTRLNLDGEDTPYADWLIAIFERWIQDNDSLFRIRFFENIIGLIFGDSESSDNIGGRQNPILVVETDGGLEPLDMLRICGDGFTKLGYNVFKNEIDEVFESSLVRTYFDGASALCDTCLRCPILKVCGGGYLPHRFSRSRGFDNPSVYCRDLMRLITHIQGSVVRQLPIELQLKLSIAPLEYNQVRHTLFSPTGPLGRSDPIAASAAQPPDCYR